MTTFMKLKTAGESHTFELASVSEDSAGNWPDYHFLATTGEVVVVPKGAADRQLEFLEVKAFAELVGHKLIVSRSTKVGANGKPFWDVSRSLSGDATTAPPKTNGKPVVATALLPNETGDEDYLPDGPDQDEKQEAKELRAYRKLTQWYLAEIVPLMDKAEVGTTPESVGAGIATLYISFKGKLS